MAVQEEALPGFGAFKPSDVADAERRHPVGDLEAYARARGLEPLGSRNPAGYRGVVPGDERLQFNVVRGTLPGGRHGILLHRVRQVGVRLDRHRWWPEIGADVHGLHFAPKPAVKPRQLLSLLPVVGEWLEPPTTDDRPAAIGVPTTVAATLVPQAATLSSFELVNYGVAGRARVELARAGLPGVAAIALAGWPDPDREEIHRLVATSFGDALRRLAHRPFLEVKVDHGQLSIAVDGYLHDADELDALARALALAAQGLVAACARRHDPRPFEAPLLDASWPERLSLAEGLSWDAAASRPPGPWIAPLRDLVRRHGATPEDPVAYHRAFPALPVPGRACVVLRIPVGTDGRTGRLAWHAERSMARFNMGRNAVLLPAAPGLPDTSAGGVRHAGLNLVHAVSDGVFCAWQGRDHEAGGGLGDPEGLLEQVTGFARAEGLVADL